MADDTGVGVIVQARMRSQRLPGKVLRFVAGKPMLQLVLERVSRCTRIGRVVVATSDHAADDPVAAFCRVRGVACFRGDHDNVACRMCCALQAYGLDAFVRVCGDSPLIDPELIDHAIGLFDRGEYDIVTNNLERSYPSGQTVEIMSTPAYLRGCRTMRTADHFEHVTRYFYEHPASFRILNFTDTEDWSDVKLSVDTQDDLDRITTIIEAMDRPHWAYGWREIVADHCTMSQ